MTERSQRFHVRAARVAALATTLAAVGGLAAAAPALADPAPPAPVCGTPTPVTGQSATLSVPAYNGSGTLSGVSLSLEVSETISGVFRNGTTFALEPSTATLDYVGASNFIEATGPGLATLPASVSVASTFSGSPGSFAGPSGPLPSFDAGVAGAEGRSAYGTSTLATAPSDWSALGYAYTPGSAPVTASGAQSFTLQSAAVPSGSFGAWTGGGSVSIPVVSFASSTVAFSSATNQLGGVDATPTITACATYTVLASALPEVPSTILLPGAAALIGAGALVVSRRRRSRLA